MATLALTGSASAAPQFTAPYLFFGAGMNPQSTVCGDFNGDGDADLAVLNGLTSSVTILLGNGGGTFGAATQYPVANGGRAAAVADLNGDGKEDLVISTYGPAVVMLGRGDGTFQDWSVVQGANGAALALGDLNGDHRPDLVIANMGLVVLLGNGDGTFGAPSAVNPSDDYYTTVAIDDLNGDGHADLVATCYTQSTLLVLLGDGTGTFGAATVYPTGGHPEALLTGDLNRDGHPDVLVVNMGNNTLSVRLGNGDGTLGSAVDYRGFYTRSIALGDVDRDGAVDLIVAYGDISVMRGRGDGTFGPGGNFPVNWRASSAVIADFNRDGHPDIAAGSDSGISLLLGNGDGTFGSYTGFDVCGGTMCMAMGDLNVDGVPDLVTASNGDCVSILLGSGNATFTARPNLTAANMSYPSWVAIGDLNGDGRPDLAVSNRNADMASVFLGLGDGLFGPRTDYTVGNYPVSVAILDANLDGRLDLLVLNGGSNTMSVLIGRGDGTFGANIEYATGTYPSAMAIGDLNADTRPDVVITNKNANTASVFLAGAFNARHDYATGEGPLCIALGDLNGDDRADLVVGGQGSMSCWYSVLLGNGDGSFALHRDRTLSSVPSQLVIANLDGNPIPDLAMAFQNWGILSVFPGNGDGTFRDPQLYGSPAATALAVADFNGDHWPDIAAAGYSFFGSQVSIHFAIPDLATPALVSLVASEAAIDHARIEWYAPDAAGREIVVARGTRGGAWTEIGRPVVDGSGMVAFVDHDVVPGAEYGYRLSLNDADPAATYGETWLTIPARIALALHGLRPNPAVGRYAVAFTLPDEQPGRLEVFDLVGRRVLERNTAGMGAGMHVLDLSEGQRLPPGLYMLKLSHGHETRTVRGVIVR